MPASNQQRRYSNREQRWAKWRGNDLRSLMVEAMIMIVIYQDHWIWDLTMYMGSAPDVDIDSLTCFMINAL